MTSILIQGGTVVTPDALLRADVRLRDGRIAEIAPTITPEASERVLDATGCWVGPGFVDLHTHLREPGFEGKERIATGTLAAARGGFTTVCAMPNTMPPLDSRPAIESVLREADASGVVRVRITDLTSGYSREYGLARRG